jgi:hypothetical protein
MTEAADRIMSFSRVYTHYHEEESFLEACVLIRSLLFEIHSDLES